MRARTRVPREKSEERSSWRYLFSPLARNARAREYMPTKEMNAETGAEIKRARPARDTRKQIPIKEGRANFGKQMKSHVRHLV